MNTDKNVDRKVNKDMYSITIMKNDILVSQFNILEDQAFSLLDVFRSSRSFENASGNVINGWIFKLETDKQVEDVTKFITTGIRPLTSSNSASLISTEVDLVYGYKLIKPDYKYPTYLIESGLDEFNAIWKREFEVRKRFVYFAKKYGAYVSNDKINGQIQNQVFEYTGSVYTKKIDHERNILIARSDNQTIMYSVSQYRTFAVNNYYDGNMYNITPKYAAPENVYKYFTQMIPQSQLQDLFNAPISREYCVAGKAINSVVKMELRKQMDIYPFTGVPLKDFVSRFIKTVQKTGFVELTRTIDSINISWSYTPFSLIRKILFPYIRSTVRKVHANKVLDEVFGERIFVYGEHERLCNTITNTGIAVINDLTKDVEPSSKYLLDGVNDIKEFMVKIVTEYLDVIDGADLPDIIKVKIKQYMTEGGGTDRLVDMINKSIPFDDDKIVYSIKLQRNSSVNEVLTRMDIDEHCLALYMGKIYISRRGQHALDNGINVVDPTREHPRYFKNLIEERGTIFVPSLDDDKLVFHNRLENTSGLSRLIYLLVNKIDIGTSREYIKSVISYDADEIIKTSVKGWLESGLRVKCRYSNMLMIDVYDSVLTMENSDSITTQFYFTAYMSLFETLLYRSTINYTNGEVIKIRKYPKVDEITIDVPVQTDYSSDIIKNYIKIRGNRHVYQTPFDEIQGDEDPEEYILDIYLDMFEEEGMLYYKDILFNISGCLIIDAYESYITPYDDYTDPNSFYSIYPIVQTEDELIDFINKTVSVVERLFNVIVYKRSEEYIEIVIDNKDDVLYLEDLGMLVNSVSIINSTITVGIDNRQSEASYGRQELLSLYKIAKQTIEDNSYLRLKSIRHRRFIHAVANLNTLLNTNEDVYVIHSKEYNYNTILRIYYVQCEDLSEAFMFVQHSSLCIGWYNGSVVYNDRYKHYFETSIVVLDPGFRRDMKFEEYLHLENKEIATPYSEVPKIWIDMDISGNYHYLLRLNSIPTLVYEDKSLYRYADGIILKHDKSHHISDDNSGITPKIQDERSITFTDANMVTTSTVTTTVASMINDNKPKTYRLDFGPYKLVRPKPLKDYHETIVNYGRLAFLAKQEAILVMSAKFKRDGDDRMQLNCVTAF